MVQELMSLESKSILSDMKKDLSSNSQHYPNHRWNIEMLEMVNYNSSLLSRLKSKRIFEIFLFRKHNDKAYLVNSRPQHNEDNFTRMNPSSPIYLLEDLKTSRFSAIFPKNAAVCEIHNIYTYDICLILYRWCF